MSGVGFHLQFSALAAAVEEKRNEGFKTSYSRQTSTSSTPTTVDVDSLTESLVPFSRQCSETLSQVVSESDVIAAIRSVVTQSTFAVTISDPSFEDVSLIAVSDELEEITGFSREELIGSNGRCICDLYDLSNVHLSGMMSAYATGAPFTGIIQNRKKTGELFLNLVDMRGMVIAENDETGDELWFLVGIHADVSDMYDEDPEHHLPALAEIANKLRDSLMCTNSMVGIADALATGAEISAGNEGACKWRILDEPRWRHGSANVF